MKNVLELQQSDFTEKERGRERDRQTETGRQRQREVMNWVTFNYACVYVSICPVH